MIDLTQLDKWRVKTPQVLDLYGSYGNSTCGVFEIRYAGNKRNELSVIAAVGNGWDHVSVSLKKRVPTYYEMKWVKNLFFKPDEVAVEFHVPTTDHVNLHDHCLHLWRPIDAPFPMPPQGFV